MATTADKRTLSAARREARVSRYMPQVNYIARRIHDRLPPQVPLADLVQAGAVGLLDAIERFDPSRGVAFGAYAAIRIRGAILDSLREIDWSPRELRHTARQVEAAGAHLEQQLGRSATEAEISEFLELPLQAFRRLLAEIKGLDLFPWTATTRRGALVDGRARSRTRARRARTSAACGANCTICWPRRSSASRSMNSRCWRSTMKRNSR